jgi:hypothetical protein
MPKTVNVCDDNWHGVKRLKFKWNNNTKTTCTLTQNDGSTFPFVGGPPLSIPPGISDGELTDLGDGTYTYDVDCCDRMTTPKNVLIP